MLMNNDVIGISRCLKQRPSFPLYSCLLHLPMIAIKQYFGKIYRTKKLNNGSRVTGSAI